ncbi:MAG: NAD(P)/FAD-dependent oxidoreductase [Verrucomicrobiae bacterium]
MKFDVIVVGAGAAGLFCAATAGLRGRKVLVLEHNARAGEKIRISGGGRCNFTNVHAGPDNYISGNPGFCRSALARFSPQDFLALVEKHGITYHEKTQGQQFCSGSSGEILSMLLRECSAGGVEIRYGARIEDVAPGFRLRTNAGDVFSDSLVVATGGLSFAKLGASGFGHRIARQFGMSVTPLRPGLVPLILEGQTLRAFAPVSGVSLPVRTRCRQGDFEGALLVTHRGFSGPAILQISSFWNPGDRLTIDLLSGKTIPFRAGATSAPAVLSEVWPRRFADAWCSLHAPQKPLALWSDRERRRTEDLARCWPVAFAGTEGYAKAEVTLGGVDTGGLSSKTMESRTQSGLFFIGEVVDVTGWLGGYNFHWAWASARAAGEAA